jgi:hypothetical protein
MSKEGDMIHDPRSDVSEVRRPTPAEREVLDLLGLNPAPSPWVRLSLTDWRRVDDVAAALAGARMQTAVTARQAVRTDAALRA